MSNHSFFSQLIHNLTIFLVYNRFEGGEGMTNKDRLICLFESEGLDINQFVCEKEKGMFLNEQRKEYLEQKNEEIRRVMKNHNHTYLDLCKIEGLVGEAESRIYEKYPNNPYLYNYKNDFLRNQRICDCINEIDGKKISLDTVNGFSTNEKKDCLDRIKGKWIEENKDYLLKRKKISLTYVESTYYSEKKKVHITRNSWFVMIMNDFITLVLGLLAFGDIKEMISPEISSYYNYWVKTGTLPVVFSLFLVFTVLDFALIFANKDRTLDKISNNYNRLIDRSDTLVNNLGHKQMVSKTKLISFENLRRRADEIDREYFSKKNNAPFIIKYNGLKMLGYITLFVTFGFACYTFGLAIAIVSLVCLAVIRGIFQGR